MDFKFNIVTSFLLITTCLVQNCSAGGGIEFSRKPEAIIPTSQGDNAGQSSTGNNVLNAQKLPIDEIGSLPLCVDGNYQYNKGLEKGCNDMCKKKLYYVDRKGGECYVTKGYAHCRCWLYIFSSSQTKDYDLYSVNGNCIGREWTRGVISNKEKFANGRYKLSDYASDSSPPLPILPPGRKLHRKMLL